MKKLLKFVACLMLAASSIAVWKYWYESHTLDLEIGGAIMENSYSALPGDQKGPLKMERLEIVYTESDPSDSSLVYVFGRNSEGQGVLVKVPAKIPLGSMIGKTLHFRHQMVGRDRLGEPYYPNIGGYTSFLSKG